MKPGESLALYLIFCSLGLLVVFKSAERINPPVQNIPSQSFSLGDL